MSQLALILAQTEELAPLIMPSWVFAAIAAAVFATLGFVTWSFRDVANRHSDKVTPSSTDSHGNGH